MRIGENPEKRKLRKNILKNHRVIMVFYIPDTEEVYFEKLDSVFEKSLSSLIATINPETTNITLVNNNSSDKLNTIVEKYKEYIDKYIVYSENKGKVYAVLNEARAALEDFVTITDADILFFDGWEKAVFDVYAAYPGAGVVSPHPCPYLTFYFNQNVFSKNSVIGNISYGKYVKDYDIDLYIDGTNLPKIIDRKTKFNWKEKQFILQHPKPVVIGAYHVVATYRVEQFRNVFTFPEFKFKNSYEEDFIDCLADSKGMVRLSTLDSYIYHMGNTIDEVVLTNKNRKEGFVTKADIEKIKKIKLKNPLLIRVNRIIGRIFIKFKWIKM